MSQPTPSDLLAVSHHLFYEIWMFYESARFLKQDSKTDVVLTNVCLESFTVHGRILLDFFYNKAQKDDVIAEHYIENWKEICPMLQDNLKKLSYRVGKEIAHLTYARLKVTAETRGWNTMAAENELHLVIKKFQENVPRNLVVEKLLQLKPTTGRAMPTPTKSARPFYVTNTGAWLFKP